MNCTEYLCTAIAKVGGCVNLLYYMDGAVKVSLPSVISWFFFINIVHSKINANKDTSLLKILLGSDDFMINSTLEMPYILRKRNIL